MVKNPHNPQVVVSGQLIHQNPKEESEKVSLSRCRQSAAIARVHGRRTPNPAAASARIARSSSSPMKAAPLVHASGLLSYMKVCKRFKSTAKRCEAQALSPS